MKNLRTLLLVGSLAFLAIGTSAADADVGKIKNSELAIGQYDNLDLAVCEYTPVFDICFESQTIELASSPANEFGILPDMYTGEKMWLYYSPVNYWILFKHLIDQPKHGNAILAPRDKLSC